MSLSLARSALYRGSVSIVIYAVFYILQISGAQKCQTVTYFFNNCTKLVLKSLGKHIPLFCFQIFKNTEFQFQYAV